MDSHTTAPTTNNSSSHSSLEDAPLLNLLNQDLGSMDFDQLRAHTQNLRDVTSSTVTLKSQLSSDKAANKPAKGTGNKGAVKTAELMSKYLNLGK